MPLYELLCLAKPALPRADMARMMQKAGEVVLDKGGVLTNLTSFGDQHLAYNIRRPFEKYDKVRHRLLCTCVSSSFLSVLSVRV